MSQQPTPFLTPNEAAALLGLSPATLATWRCRRSDGPPYRKIGPKRVLYPYLELIQWVEGHGLQTSTAAPPTPPGQQPEE